MNKNFLHLFLIAGLLLCCTSTLFSLDNDGKKMPVARRRAITYYPDGAIKSIKETYPNNQTVKKIYDEAETLVEKILSDGSLVTYSYEFEDGIKIVTEHYDNEGIIIKRHFNNKNQIVKSVYPEYTEQYEYIYDSIGDVNKVIIINDNGDRKEIEPDDNRLSFLYDYDIIDSTIMDDFSRMNNKEYIYNPTKFKENMNLHRKYQKLPKY